VEIPDQKLMATAAPYYVMDGHDFVAYPNRDSVPFRQLYDVSEAHTVVRGSFRYKGNSALVKALIDLDWLDTSAKDQLVPGFTWTEIRNRMI